MNRLTDHGSNPIRLVVGAILDGNVTESNVTRTTMIVEKASGGHNPENEG